MIDNQIIKGNCFEIIKDFPDGCFDAIIIDPPYLYLKHRLDKPYNEEDLINESYRLLKKKLF